MPKSIILFVLSLVVYVVFVSPVWIEWNDMIQAFGVLVIAQILWIGGVFPSPFTALLLMLIVSFHFFSYEETLSFLGSDVVWLLFATYLLAGAFLESGLAYRISLYVLRLSKGSGKLLLLLLMLLILMLSVFVPSNIGRGNLIVSVLDNIAGHLKRLGHAKNISKALFIGGSYIVSIGGAAVVTGANSTLYTFSMLNDNTSGEMTYLSWILLFVPPIVLFIVGLWIVLLRFYPPEQINSREVVRYIQAEIDRLGRIKRSEIKMMVIIGLTVCLWILQPFHGYSISMIGMLGAVLTMFPLAGIWDWGRAQKEINWGMLLFFASTLMLSHLLIHTGALYLVAEWFVDYVPFEGTMVILLILIIGTLLLRTMFVSILGFMTIMIPLGLEIGGQLGTIPPLLIAMVVFLAGVPGFFLVTQSPVNMIYFSYGYFTEKDLLRVGGAASLLWIVIVLASVEYYWSAFHLG